MAIIHGQRGIYLSTQKELARRRFYIFLFAFIFLCIIYFLLILRYNNNLFLGIIFAAFLISSLLVYIRAKKQIKRSCQFKKGEEGELVIFKVLQKLPDCYHIFQNLQINNNFDIDFVVVGPSGVFAVEVKSHKGVIGFNGEALTINGQLFEKNILGQTMNGALSLKNFLGIKFVYPVLVFANKYAKVRFGFDAVKGVYVLRKEFLLKGISREIGGEYSLDNFHIGQIVKKLVSKFCQ